MRGQPGLKIASSASLFPAFFLFAVFTVFSASPLLAEKGPRIQFNELSRDFGRVKEGDVLTHVFVFRNIGDETLQISRVTTSCGCAAALASEDQVAPGKSGEIKVTFNTRGYGGRVSKSVQVHTNDPKERVKQLIVSADIEVPPRPRIELDRYTVDLGLFLDEEEIRARAAVKNRGELELTVECSHKDAAFFSGGKPLSAPLRVAAGKEKEIEIRIPPRKRPGVMREYVLLKTNDPRRPQLSFNVSGYVVTRKQLKELFDKYRDILK